MDVSEILNVVKAPDRMAGHPVYDSAHLTAGKSAGYLNDNRPDVVQKKMLQYDKRSETQKGISVIPIQTKANNNTGLPNQLKAGVENLSGISMDDVKVHYNSSQPAQLQAHAYAQGTDIHIAHGQEKHLPHEAWHVVQQKQGRVKPTMQMKGKVNVNDDKGLEKEADVMGARALEARGKSLSNQPTGNKIGYNSLTTPLQRYVVAPIALAGANWRTSNGGAFRLEPQTKNLQATAAAITAANTSLIAAKSSIRLTQRAAIAGGGNFHAVVIGMNAAKSRTSANIGEDRHANMEDARTAAVDPLLMWADCSKASAEVSGSKSGNRSADKVVMNVQGTKGGIKPGIRMDGLHDSEKDSSAAHFANSVYIELLDRFIAANRAAAFLVAGYHYNTTAGSARRKLLNLAPTTTFKDTTKSRSAGFSANVPLQPGPRARAMYDALLPAGKAAFDAYAGINMAAAPVIGQSYAMATEYSMPGAAAHAGQMRWVYHYAGVIMVDGTDRITLENYSVGDNKAVNSNWHLQMYGTAVGETFHEQHLASLVHGTHATSMTIGNG